LSLETRVVMVSWCRCLVVSLSRGVVVGRRRNLVDMTQKNVEFGKEVMSSHGFDAFAFHGLVPHSLSRFSKFGQR